MSAILNTLKKLEEEKSVFEQNLDVQDLALHQEFGSNSSFVQVNRNRSKLIIVALPFIILIVLVSLFFYFRPINSHEKQSLAINSFFDNSKVTSLNEVKLPKNGSVSGISMNQILVNRVGKNYLEPASSKASKTNSMSIEVSRAEGVGSLESEGWVFHENNSIKNKDEFLSLNNQIAEITERLTEEKK